LNLALGGALGWRRVAGSERSDGHPYLVAVTGYGQPEGRQRALAAGFEDHLVKPVDGKGLERLMAARAAGTQSRVPGTDT
jgi:CheY-like chemotaxis protein